MDFRRILQFLVSVLISTATTTLLVVGIHFLMDGVPLMGIPKAESVTALRITCTEYAGNVVETEDAGQIELACNLKNFLNYRPFAKVDPSDVPEITMTYLDADGTATELSASRYTVWYRGKAHRLRQDSTFINLTRGVFFFQQEAEKELTE